jgi:Tfp pilus assembly protein PilF
MLLRALAKEPEDRYQKVEELRDALEMTLGPQLTQASPRTTAVAASPRRRRMPWWAWIGSAALITCLFGTLLVGALALRNRNQRPPVRDNKPIAASVAADRPDVSQQSNDERPREALPPEDRPPEPEPPQAQPPPGDRPDNVDPAAHQRAVELTEQASQALRTDEFEAAVELYDQALAADPHYLPAYFGLSDAFNQVGDPGASIQVLEHAVANNPGMTSPLMRLGEAQLFTAQNPEAALAAFEEAVALEPESPTPYAGQALALLFLDQDEAAREAIDAALMLDPASQEAHLANAAFLAKQGHRLQAIEEIQQIIQDRTAPFFVRERARQLLARIRE